MKKNIALQQRAGGEYRRIIGMTPTQRKSDLARYDAEDLSAGHRLDATDRAILRCAKAKGAGRPRVGLGVKVVPISIERGLLSQADAFARQHQLKRSQLVAQGLRLVMARKAG